LFQKSYVLPLVRQAAALGLDAGTIHRLIDEQIGKIGWDGPLTYLEGSAKEPNGPSGKSSGSSKKMAKDREKSTATPREKNHMPEEADSLIKEMDALSEEMERKGE
jgi:hypothetical protein